PDPVVRVHKAFVRDQEQGRQRRRPKQVITMKGPLLYRPAPRWQVLAAFGGAIALHLAAVGIAAIRPAEKIVDLSDIPEATVEMSLETHQEPPQPTPPPDA